MTKTATPLPPQPEDFLELVQKWKRGRLKLYIIASLEDEDPP